MTIDHLRQMKHDVVTAKDLGLQGGTDEDLLIKARETDRILITRDKDFGGLVFLKKELSTGVILLRVTPSTVKLVHREFERLLEEHPEDELKGVSLSLHHIGTEFVGCQLSDNL